MPVWAWIAIAVAVVVVVAVVAVTTTHRKRSRRTSELRSHFGPEYERALESSGGRRKGETELERRLDRRHDLQIMAVRPSERRAYDTDWSVVESQFDDAPLPSVARADALVMTVLADCGYPLNASFERRAALLSVDHSETVEHYRRAHATLRRSDEGSVSREDLFEALQHYRALLDDLVGDGRPERSPHDELAPEDGFAEDGGRRDSR